MYENQPRLVDPAIEIFAQLNSKPRALKLNYLSKKASDILYNSSSVSYAGEMHAKLKKLILQSYKNLEQDPLLKYFTYVTALNTFEAYNEKKSTIFFIDQTSVKEEYKAVLSMDGWTYKSENDRKMMVITFHPDYIVNRFFEGKDFAVEAGFLAHELVHLSYAIVYKNAAHPYPINNETTKLEYKNTILTCIEADFSNFVSKDPFTPSERCFIDVFKIHPELNLGIEIIAYCIGNYYLYEYKNIDELCPGFDAFIKQNTIPDFIKYIENHPNCSDVTYYDESIYCAFSGGQLKLQNEDL